MVHRRKHVTRRNCFSLLAGLFGLSQVFRTAGGLAQLASTPKRQVADGPELRQLAREALVKAVRFFVDKVAVEGGYVWRYSADLQYREGEDRATATTVWVQPPGTPTVGDALLAAYERTGEELCLLGAKQAGICLTRGQLESGGWTYRIEFDPGARRRYFYRVEPRKVNGFNVSTLDDNTTQSALSFLMRLDRALGFEDKALSECIRYGLERLMAGQYPCGAWPQGFREPPEPEKYPVLRANYPESVPPAPDFKEYWRFYTLNDFAHMDTIRTFLLAAEVYNDDKYLAAAVKGGEFLLLAQMPEPQPAWAQQYNFQMQPAWARKFEPPAITGFESQEVLRVLLLVYRRTRKAEFLEPIPRALEYLRRSLLPGGQLARFYELKTNRPLYFTRDYRLTYDDSDLPRHYAFKVSSDLDDIARDFERAAKAEQDVDMKETDRRRPFSRSQLATVWEIIHRLDERGAWVESGSLDSAPKTVTQVIDTRTFIRHVDILSRYLASPPA